MKKKENIQEEYTKVWNQHTAIEHIVDDIKEKQFKRVFMIGCGGAYTKMFSIYNFVKNNIDIPVYIEDPTELIYCLTKIIDEQTLILLGSKTGVTKEVIEAARFCKEKKATIVGFICMDNTPLEQEVDYRINSICTDVHILHLAMFWMRFCEVQGTYKGYASFLDNIKNIANQVQENALHQIIEAKPFVESIANGSFTMFVASGNLIGEARCSTNYVIEEINWIPAQTIHSGEFFHGPFELLDDKLPLLLIKGDQSTRYMDERVESFLQKHGKTYFILDLAKFHLDNLTDEQKDIVNPWLVTKVIYQMESQLGQLRQRSAETRRYYRLFEY